jgi:transketolase
MKYSPADPSWINRDRFVLSNGHACALQYVMLHLTGYGLTIDDLQNFRQLNSKTPGHPENFVTDGVEVSTGPLGQGLSNAVGMAMASAHLGATFNRDGFDVIDNFTYVICGDGCLQEGVTSEASSLAGHLGLGKLIVLYDDNKITIDGSTDLSFTEDVIKRYESYGWHTQHVENGDDDFGALLAAIEAAKQVTDQPSMIKVTTTIGFGSAKAGTAKVHGAPLGDEDLANLKTSVGQDPAASFAVPVEVSDFYKQFYGSAAADAWKTMFAAYTEVSMHNERCAHYVHCCGLPGFPRSGCRAAEAHLRCVPRQLMHSMTDHQVAHR